MPGNDGGDALRQTPAVMRQLGLIIMNTLALAYRHA
jgi:hypothetical protein